MNSQQLPTDGGPTMLGDCAKIVIPIMTSSSVTHIPKDLVKEIIKCHSMFTPTQLRDEWIQQEANILMKHRIEEDEKFKKQNEKFFEQQRMEENLKFFPY